MLNYLFHCIPCKKHPFHSFHIQLNFKIFSIFSALLGLLIKWYMTKVASPYNSITFFWVGGIIWSLCWIYIFYLNLIIVGYIAIIAKKSFQENLNRNTTFNGNLMGILLTQQTLEYLWWTLTNNENLSFRNSQELKILYHIILFNPSILQYL